MKFPRLAFIVLFLAVTAAWADDSQDPSLSAAAGTVKNGVYSTFYTANIVVRPGDKTIDEIPGLSETIQFISQYKSLSSKTIAQIVQALVPTSRRTYFDASKEDFCGEMKKKIIEEYSRVTGLPGNQVILYALTDKDAKRTFLLPEFYSLSKPDQMAVLFHQGENLVNPNMDEDKISLREGAFEAAYLNPGSLEDSYKFVTLAGNWVDALRASIRADQATGVLNAKSQLINDRDMLELTPENLFGHDFTACAIASGNPVDNCYDRLSVQAALLPQSFPNSMFAKFWRQAVLEHRVIVELEFYGTEAKLTSDSFSHDVFRFSNAVLDEPEPIFEIQWSKKRSFARYRDEQYKYRYHFSFRIDAGSNNGS